MIWKYGEEKENILETILSNRNITRDQYDMLINNPIALFEFQALNNTSEAIALINKHVANHSNIYIFADYDCDGLTSGAMLYSFLKERTNNVEVYFPDREEGYGLNKKFCEYIVENNKFALEKILIITVDNGTSCLEQIDFLNDNKIDVLVTDHHQPQDKLPNCLIVNPHTEENSKYTYLSGCGVVFKLICQMATELDSDYFILLMLSTISDVMPLTIENLAFCSLGLQLLNNKQCSNNLKSLKDFFGNKSNLTGEDIAWKVVPAINACSRMNNINIAAKFFLNKEDELEVYNMQAINEKRKRVTKEAEKEIDQMDFSNDNVCFFNGENYPIGILGIIAGKISEKTNKPSICYKESGDKLACSIRSNGTIDILIHLKEEVREGNLESCGGHAAACGAEINKAKLEDLISSLNNRVSTSMETCQEENNTLTIDKKLSIKDIDKNLFTIVSSLTYDKDMFSVPIFALDKVTVKKVKSSRNNPDNICFTIEDETGKMDIWAWRFGSIYKELGEPKVLSIAGSIDRDFQNTNKITLKIVDIVC